MKICCTNKPTEPNQCLFCSEGVCQFTDSPCKTEECEHLEELFVGGGEDE